MAGFSGVWVVCQVLMEYEFLGHVVVESELLPGFSGVWVICQVLVEYELCARF